MKAHMDVTTFWHATFWNINITVCRKTRPFKLSFWDKFILNELLNCSVCQIIFYRALHRASEVFQYFHCCVKVADGVSLILVCKVLCFTATRLLTLVKIGRVLSTVTVLFGNGVSMVYSQHLSLYVCMEILVELFHGHSSRHIHSMVPGFFHNKNWFILDV